MGYTRVGLDDVFSVKQVTEKSRANDIEINMKFIDLGKAYDSVPRKQLQEVVKRTSANAANKNRQ